MSFPNQVEWTEGEKAKLESMCDVGYSYSFIAFELKRTKSAVKAMVSCLELSNGKRGKYPRVRGVRK